MRSKQSRARGRLEVPAALVVIALAALSIGCHHDLAAEEAAAEAPAEAMASVGDEMISRVDVEQLVESQLRDLERQRYEVLERGLSQLIENKLIELEAAARGLTPEALLAAEIADKAGEVSDEDIDGFYEQNKARIPQPKEQVAGQIRQYLEQQRNAELRSDLIKALRSSYRVRSYLEPHRLEVASSGFPAKGPADAPVTIVEFSDFECPFCSRVLPTLDQITERYGDKVRIVFRQFPLDSLHPRARKAAEASLCANDQGKFWEMHDAMFANQRQLGIDDLKRQAGEIGLESQTFDECLDSGRYADRVQQDVEAGRKLGVSGTPAFVVNGRFLSGAQPFEAFAKLIDDELERAGGG